MKTLAEVKDELKNYNGRPIKIMEVCGTHTGSIFKNGIRSLLSPKIQLISGPGCPVCVTSTSYINRLVELSCLEKHCILTFGDMMKVKGTEYSLTEAKAIGAKVEILYSPLGAIAKAQASPDIQYVFAAVGFETTTPIYALMMEEILAKDIKNLKLLTSIKTIIPALTFICKNEQGIDAFLSPGHVSAIIGSKAYEGLAKRYHKPFVIAGFEGEHILAAVYDIITQLNTEKSLVTNRYQSVVTTEGNAKAKELVERYFECVDDSWRGIGVIEGSALRLRKEYSAYDAGSEREYMEEKQPKGCRCTDVILGRIQPVECGLFKKVCTPMSAVGPCMVSTEGACGIWYKNI